MDVRPTLTDCDEARDYVVSNVLSPRDLVSRPDNMDETRHPGFNLIRCYKPNIDRNNTNINNPMQSSLYNGNNVTAKTNVIVCLLI